MDDLKKFYEVEAGELDAGEKPLAPSAAYREATKKQDPARKIIRLGNEQARLDQQMQELGRTMDQARIKEGEPPETPSRLEALGALINQFYKAARVVRVKLVEPLLDKDGAAMRKFAMKELDGDADKADRQMARLKADLEIAKKYLPDLELNEITTKDNKRVVIVTGASAEDFNAVVMAEKTRLMWEKQSEQLKAELEKAHQEIAENKKARQADTARDRFMATKDKENEPPALVH